MNQSLLRRILSATVFSILLVGFPLRGAAETPFILGAWYTPNDLQGQTLQQFEQSLGVFFNSHKQYINWDQPMNTWFANQMHAEGRIPEITWQPWVNGVGLAYGDIANGMYDNYITTFAQAVKSLPFTIQLALSPEMNGTWSPWAINGQPGRTAKDFIKGWRHVHGIFQQTGATNVEWIWAPNVVPDGPSSWIVYSFAELYPGHEYVTHMGLDGYNWGDYWPGQNQWQSFREVFQHSYNLLTAISTKNILIMEVASIETPGDKAAWIRDMFRELPNFPKIRGFTWFNRIRETDWRIASSSASKQAFKEGAAAFFAVAPTPTPSPQPTASGTTKPTPTPSSQPGENPPKSSGTAGGSQLKDTPILPQESTGTATEKAASGDPAAFERLMPFVAGVGDVRTNAALQKIEELFHTPAVVWGMAAALGALLITSLFAIARTLRRGGPGQYQ